MDVPDDQPTDDGAAPDDHGNRGDVVLRQNQQEMMSKTGKTHTGLKTFVNPLLLQLVRHHGLVALPCATTGIAALQYTKEHVQWQSSFYHQP